MSKKLLTKKQQTILILIYTFRFITSKQIQQFLLHKDHRRINSWLKDLQEKEFIIREFKPRYGVLTKPAVCSLTIRGKTFIRQTYERADRKYLTRMRNDTNRSTALKARLQIVADFCLIYINEKAFIAMCTTLLEQKITLLKNNYYFFTPAFYSKIPFILVAKLRPDCYILRRTKKGSIQSFIYIIDAYVPRLTLHYMLKHLFTVLDDENWEDERINSLHIYYICPSNMVRIYLQKALPSFLERYYSQIPLYIHFATRNQLYKKLHNPEVKINWYTFSSEEE